LVFYGVCGLAQPVIKPVRSNRLIDTTIGTPTGMAALSQIWK
jgi:hypothetical protein